MSVNALLDHEMVGGITAVRKGKLFYIASHIDFEMAPLEVWIEKSRRMI